MTDATQAKTPVHRHAIPAAIVLAVGIAVFIAGDAWASILFRLLTDGLLALVWLAAMIGIGSLVASKLDWPTRAGLGIGIASIFVLMTGWFDLLTAVSAWLVIAVGLTPALSAIARSFWSNKGFRYEVDPVRWLWVLAAPAVAVMLVAVCVLPGVLWGDEPHGYDVLEYHLQLPREWYQTRQISPLPHNVFSYFPLAMETHYLLAMHLRGGPWAGMYLAQMMHALTVIVAAAAVYRFVRPRGRFAATISAVLILATPWTSMVSSVAYNEGLLILFATLCFGWAGRAITTEDAKESRRFAIVAGVMGGFAISVKLTAVALVVGAVVIASLAIARPIRRGIVTTAIFVIAVMLTASPWLVRNIAWTGNPVFPEATGLFGTEPFSQTQVERWRAAHSPRADQSSLPAKTHALWKQVLTDWRFGFALLPVAAAMAVFGGRRAAFLSLIALAQIGVWLAFTHLQGRFLVTLIPVAALLCGTAPDRPIFRITIVSAALCASLSNLPLFGRLLDRENRVFSIEDPQLLWRLPAQSLVPLSDERVIALVGDARAFWWPTARSRLRYRTVFDVDVRPGETMVDAWLRGAWADEIVVIDPAELRRFSETYRGLGDVPADIAARDETFVRP